MYKIMDFLLLFMCFVRFVAAHDCFGSGTITCNCDANTIECNGIQSHVLEVQDILSNISSITSLIFKIDNLQFEQNYVFPKFIVQDLTLGYGLYNISSDFFSELSSTLSILNLENNKIDSIDTQPFRSLINLHDLILDYNEISSLNPDAFENLNKLEVLSISNNNLSSIGGSVLSHLPSLHIFTISHNNLGVIHNMNISSPSLLKLFAVNCSINGTLEKESLSGMPNLIEFDLSYNSLIEVGSNALSAMKDLRSLNLSFNSIKGLQENAFSELRNLTYLDLKNNQISMVRMTSFSGLLSLKVLDLSGNRLSAVLCDYTTDFAALEKLHLQNNEIKTFTSGTLYYSPSLRELNLEGNALECTCELTDVANYLIQNSSISASDLNSVFCIIPLTVDHMPITDFKSSKCIPKDPCKIVSANIDDDDYDYYDDDHTTVSSVPVLNSSITTEISTVPSSISDLPPVSRTTVSVTTEISTEISESATVLTTSQASSTVNEITTEVTTLTSSSVVTDPTNLTVSSATEMGTTTVYPVIGIKINTADTTTRTEMSGTDHTKEIDTTSVEPMVINETTSTDSTTENNTSSVIAGIRIETTNITSANITTEIASVNPITRSASVNPITRMKTTKSRIEMTDTYHTKILDTTTNADPMTMNETTSTDPTTENTSSVKPGIRIKTTSITSTTNPVTEIESTSIDSPSRIETTITESTKRIENTSIDPMTSIETTSTKPTIKIETFSANSTDIIESTSTDFPTKFKITTPYFGFTKDKVIEVSSCSLDLLIPYSNSDTDLIIYKNFTFDGSIFCMKWSVGGSLPFKSRCTIKYTYALGTQSENLKCPTFPNEIREWSKKANIFRFCLIIYANKKIDSCVKVSERTTTAASDRSLNTRTTVATTFRESTTTPLGSDAVTSKAPSIVSETSDRNLTTHTTVATTFSESTTTPSGFDAVTSTAPSIVSETSSFIAPFNESVMHTETEPVIFNLTEFWVFFNHSKFAYVKWGVNKEFPTSQCVLALTVTTQLFDHNEGTFPCKNDTIILKSVKEDDMFNMCLISKHTVHGVSKVCRFSLGDTVIHSDASKSEYKPFHKTSSMIPLIVILVLCLLIVLFVVFKNMFRKRLESETYHVREEEEKLRVSIRPSSVHENSTVRYSYIAKEHPEAL